MGEGRLGCFVLIDYHYKEYTIFKRIAAKNADPCYGCALGLGRHGPGEKLAMMHVLDQLTKLAESGKRLINVNSFKNLYETVFDLVEEIFNSDTAAILLKNTKDGALSIAAARGYDQTAVEKFSSTSPGRGVTGYVFETGEPQLVSETVNDPRYIRGVANAVSEMAVPLHTPDGIIGVLDMESRHGRFTTADLALFTAFGEHVAIAVRNLRLQQRLEERARRLVVVSKAGQSITAIDDLDALLSRILLLTSDALDLDTCAIQLWDDSNENLVVTAAKGYDSNIVGLKVPRGRGVTGRAAEEGRPSVIPDINKIDDYIPGLKGCRSEMAVPMVFRGAVIGVLNAEHKEADRFDETDLLLATIFADHAASAIGNTQFRLVLEQKNKVLTARNQVLTCLAKAGTKIHQVSDVADLTGEILTGTAQALKVPRIRLLLPNAAGAALEIHSAHGDWHKADDPSMPEPRSIVFEAYRTGQPVLGPGMHMPPEQNPGNAPVHCEIAIPLAIGKTVLGVLHASSDTNRQLANEDRRTLELTAAWLAPFFNH
ncbi:MAG: GAF domain-containing protein [Myxococcota bacterium]|nr:GAF domain-containing protein [Myxococcota bacterium]